MSRAVYKKPAPRSASLVPLAPTQALTRALLGICYDFVLLGGIVLRPTNTPVAEYPDRYTRGVAYINSAAQPFACVDRDHSLINVELAKTDRAV
jgi:hypothetical protein